MIQQDSPQRFDWRNFRRKFRTRSIGDIHLIEMEIDAETWQALDTMPKDADGEMVIWWTTRGEAVGKERTPKPLKKPTPYGAFWHEMDKSGFHNRPDVRAWLSVLWNDLDPKQAIRNQFQTTSRASGISPDELLSVLRKFEMADAVSFVENIKAKTNQ